MSDSTAHGPSAIGRRHGRMLNFWLLATICSIWTEGASMGLPGTSRRRARPIDCPKCHQLAISQRDGSYRCVNDHVCRRQDDGSYKCDE